MRRALTFSLLIFGMQEGFAQMYASTGVSYGVFKNVDLGFSNETGNIYFYPSESIAGNTSSVPFEFGLSMVDQSLDMGVGLTFGYLFATEGSTTTTAGFVMPTYSLDMYFLQRDPFYLGFGAQIRYSAVNLNKSFNMDLDDTPGAETYSTNARWAGMGYRLQATGKYLFLSGTTALKIGAGYFFDHRKLKSLSVDSEDMPFDADSPSNTFDMGGLELNLSVQFLFGGN